MKKLVLIATVFCIPTLLWGQNASFLKEMNWASIDSCIAQSDFPRAYVNIKNLERKTPNFDAEIAHKKLNILLHLADFKNTSNVFYKEMDQTIADLTATYDGETTEGLKVDIENVRIIEMNYLNKGEVLTKWKADKQYQLGVHFLNKEFVKEAIDKLSRSAYEGNALAYYELGQMYEQGKIVPIDIDAAYDFYESAAELNYGKAYGAVARCITKEIDGTIVEERSGTDEENYKKYLLLAINTNDSEAMFAYAKQLLKTKNKQNQIEAYEMLLRAAALDNIYAYAELAEMHCKGIGTSASNQEASYWIKKLENTKKVSNQLIVELRDCIKDL